MSSARSPLVRSHTYYEELTSGDSDEGDDLLKHRLVRVAHREVRRFAELPLFGRDSVVAWFYQTSRGVFVFYTCYTLLAIAGEDYIATLREHFHATTTPYLVTAMQLITAFLMGFSMNHGIARFKSALSALVELQDDVEHFRVSALATTHDPKIRVSIQCVLVWMLVLMRKNIAFYTKDYSRPLSDIVDPLQSAKRNPEEDISRCVLFETEVVWTFDHPHVGFIMRHLLSAARLDSKEADMNTALNGLLKTWKAIENILQVRTPTTSIAITKLAMHLWLMCVPIFGDEFSRMAAPLVAVLFHAIISLSAELSDPWGSSFHDLPLDKIMQACAAPAWNHAEKGVIQDSIDWLNRGLTTDDWTHNDPEYPIPRLSKNGPSKGMTINFESMLPLYEVAGFSTWERFIASAEKDCAAAEKRGRTMPHYAKTAQKRGLSTGPTALFGSMPKSPKA